MCTHRGGQLRHACVHCPTYSENWTLNCICKVEFEHDVEAHGNECTLFYPHGNDDYIPASVYICKLGCVYTVVVNCGMNVYIVLQTGNLGR